MTTAAVLSRGTRMRSWALDAASEAAPWLIGWTIVSLFGFAFVPGDSRDREIARDAQNRGGSVNALAVEVHVDHDSSKYGGWHEVDGVRVRLSETDGWRDLDAVANADTLTEDVDWTEGWQDASDDTGYDLPLRVYVTNDETGGIEHVVAERDAAYWADGNRDPEIGLGIGLGSLLIGFGGAVAWALVSGRTSRPAGVAHPGETRAERRAARDREERNASAKRWRRMRRR